MKNVEAINLICRNKSVFRYDSEMTEALDLAIKALERPQGDCISRSDLRKEVVGMMINKADDLEEVEFEINATLASVCETIDNAQAVELDESVIQEVLNKRGMTAVANDYLIALHGNRPQGEWARHDEWVGGEYVGGFYHVNCPCEDGYYSKWRTNFCPNCGHPMMKGGTE